MSKGPGDLSLAERLEFAIKQLNLWYRITLITVLIGLVALSGIISMSQFYFHAEVGKHGYIDEIFVEAGEFVESGDLIAKVKVVPNVSSLNSAKNNINSVRIQVETARLAFENQENIYKRQKELFEKGVISANEFDTAQLSFNQAKQRYKQEQISLVNAQQNYDIVKTGTTIIPPPRPIIEPKRPAANPKGISHS